VILRVSLNSWNNHYYDYNNFYYYYYYYCYFHLFVFPVYLPDITRG